jgi:acetaldehyde dehydrogenase/alcohol dehydrogenase
LLTYQTLSDSALLQSRGDRLRFLRILVFGERMKTARILINTPSSQGGIGDLYNFRLAPSLTLGCGSWGGNSISENVGPQHLLNRKTVANGPRTCCDISFRPRSTSGAAACPSRWRICAGTSAA